MRRAHYQSRLICSRLPSFVEALNALDVLGDMKGASEIVAHSRLVLPAERVEQLEQALKCLRADLLSKVPLDLTGGGPLGSEVIVGARRKFYDLLTAVTRGTPKGHITRVAKTGHDLARTLASDAELPTDLRSRDVLELRAKPKYSSIGKFAVGEAGGSHPLVQSLLIPNPGPSECRTEHGRSTPCSTVTDLATPVGR